MSRAKRSLVRYELHVGFPLQPLDDAALAIGKFIMDEVFQPRVNGKIPPEHWDCWAGRDRDWNQVREWCRMTLHQREIRDDYHGGW